MHGSHVMHTLISAGEEQHAIVLISPDQCKLSLQTHMQCSALGHSETLLRLSPCMLAIWWRPLHGAARRWGQPSVLAQSTLTRTAVSQRHVAL